jgi:hypothetical protein
VSRQGRIALTGMLIAALLAGGWVRLVAPKRADAQAADAAITQAQARQASALAQIASAERARAHAQRDDATAARLSKAVPNDDDVGTLIRQLDAIARANDIDFRSAKLVGTPAAPAPAAPAAGSGTTAAGDDKAGEKAGDTAGDKAGKGAGAADEGAAAPVAATVVQPPPGASVGPAGLLTVPFSFTFDGGYLALQRFLGAIDAQARNHHGHISVRGRLITVDGFSLAAGRKGFPKLRALVSATAYVAPDAPAAAPAAPPTAPATGTTPSAGGAGG